MRLTHYQVHGEPVIRHKPYVGYYVLCACGLRIPEGDGYLENMPEAFECARLHEQSCAFDLGELFMFPEAKSDMCRELLRLVRDQVLRDAVIARLPLEAADWRATIAEAVERALVAEVWRGVWWLDPFDADSIEHMLGVLSATALASLAS